MKELSEQQITDGNVQIETFLTAKKRFGKNREYMGHIQGSEGHENYYGVVEVKDLKYYKSFDCLVPCLEKIINDCHGCQLRYGKNNEGIHISYPYCAALEWGSAPGFPKSCYGFGHTLIDALWNAIVTFITVNTNGKAV